MNYFTNLLNCNHRWTDTPLEGSARFSVLAEGQIFYTKWKFCFCDVCKTFFVIMNGKEYELKYTGRKDESN